MADNWQRLLDNVVVSDAIDPDTVLVLHTPWRRPGETDDEYLTRVAEGSVIIRPPESGHVS